MGLSSIRKLSNYLVLILCLLALSLTGWIFARWKMSQLRKDLTLAHLELDSVNHELKGLKKVLVGQEESFDVSTGESKFFERESSFLPSLEAGDRYSALIELKNFTAKFMSSSKRVDLDFSVERLPPKEGQKKVFWILLLHGSPGVVSFPKALASRSGEAVLFHRGEALELTKSSRNISAQFRLSGFVELAGADPVYASLLVYDEKGSLLTRQRRSLEILR